MCSNLNNENGFNLSSYWFDFLRRFVAFDQFMLNDLIVDATLVFYDDENRYFVFNFIQFSVKIFIILVDVVVIYKF